MNTPANPNKALWEKGDFTRIAETMRESGEALVQRLGITRGLKVLDLGCGKGAVSVKLAKNLGCRVMGIDIMPEFIDFAQKKAKDWSVQDLCEFRTEDINLSIEMESGYDLVILGSVGDVLGKPDETILKLKKTIKSGGFIILDDAYGRPGSESVYPAYDRWIQIFRFVKVNLIDAEAVDEIYLEETNDRNNGCIIRRINELKVLNPEMAAALDGYRDSQLAECEELMNDVVGVTWLLKS